jgi:hypothetical protein
MRIGAKAPPQRRLVKAARRKRVRRRRGARLVSLAGIVLFIFIFIYILVLVCKNLNT